MQRRVFSTIFCTAIATFSMVYAGKRATQENVIDIQEKRIKADIEHAKDTCQREIGDQDEQRVCGRQDVIIRRDIRKLHALERERKKKQNS